VKKKWKILLFVVLILVIAGGVFASIKIQQRGIVTVQTGRAARQDVTSLVTASGEVKPRNYINLGANAQGIITGILVKEGDHVRKHQIVARIEAVQAQAEVNAQQATVNTAMADSAAAEAGLKAMDDAIRTNEASVERAKFEAERAKVDYERFAKLVKEKLVAAQEFDQRKSQWEAAEAAVREAEARLGQIRAQKSQTYAQLTSAQRRVAQYQAMLARSSDVLAKHDVVAPLDGVVTNLPVRVGETVVPGIQNSAASTIMTIADMSLITAEVKVDETDIVNVKLNQVADVTIDAMPNKTFKGRVIEIGNTAILRSTGVAASQSAVSSQEAKDFKVVIALDNPPSEIRPGLSCTSKITTATKQKVVTIPLQALTVRQKGDLEPPAKGKKNVQAAPPADPAAEKAKKEEIQGIFVIKGEKALFRKVETGITGATDIEVLSGVNDGEEIITGSYKVIRTLRNETRVKVDNKSPAAETKTS
jgi:HlyD family secretion protein